MDPNDYDFRLEYFRPKPPFEMMEVVPSGTKDDTRAVQHYDGTAVVVGLGYKAVAGQALHKSFVYVKLFTAKPFWAEK